MGIARMKKVGLLFHSAHTEDLLNELFSLGMVEVVPFRDFEQAQEAVSDIDDKLERLRGILNYITPFETPESSRQSDTASITQFCPFLLEDKGERIASEIEKIRRIIEGLDSDIRKLENQLKNYLPWRSLTIPLSRLKESKDVIIELGSIPQNMFKLFSSLFENEPLFLYEKIRDETGTSYLFLAYHSSIAARVKENLTRCDYVRFELEIEDTVSSKVNEIEDEIRVLSRRRQRLVERITEIVSKDKRVLELLCDWYDYLKRKNEALKMGKDVGPTKFVQGWIIERNFMELKERLEKKYDGVFVFELEPEYDEIPPVALENPRPIKPIEIITKLYGLPRKGMLDPTPIIAPFYTIYFAFCLSDAGYGAILTFLSIFVMKKMKDEGIRQIGRFLFLMGLSSILVGMMVGGYFGADLESSSSSLAKFLLRFKLFDPLRDALTFFAITLLFGMVQVSLGFLLRGYIQFGESKKLPEKVKSVIIALSWAVMVLSGGVFMCFYLRPEIFGRFTAIAKHGLITGAGGIFFGSLCFGLLSGKSLFASIWEGIGFDGLYGFISVMGDLLSYSRILALGLSTGVIAGVINIVARQIKGIPFIGVILFGFVLALGHIGLTAISTLGSFVHPARLQFVEFFTKFYESGGKPFRPLEARIPIKRMS